MKGTAATDRQMSTASHTRDRHAAGGRNSTFHS